MRRIVFVVVAATLAIGVLPADATVERPVHLPWQLVDVSEDGRKVRIVFFYGGCQKADPRPITLAESTKSIDVAVTGTTLEADPGQRIACAAIAHLPLRWIKLERPVAGRRVTGGPEIPSMVTAKTVWRVRFQAGTGTPLIPRTVGLHASDARLLLLRQGFQVRGTRNGTVTSQRPKAGSNAFSHGTQRTVTLHSATR